MSLSRLFFVSAALSAVAHAIFTIDDSVCASKAANCRTYDGVGGLSGGGATSVLLPFYENSVRSDILDFLFKPSFGAALPILKVEIGGDAQSTDGAESSHMHTPYEEDYHRGYEWWLMVEAKKRNPDIKLYGLSWAFPQWVTCTPGTLSNCTGQNPYAWPEQLAAYTTKWISGAKNTYGLDIDYIGSWNERGFDSTYLKTLRATLDANGFSKTKIVASDSGWDPISTDILNDPELAAAVHTVGCHYPGTSSSASAEKTGKPLWASEDDSTYDNDIGAECFARIISRNYVLGNMTATINWNLVSAYMKGTNWYRAGLMNALSPWSGAYGSQTADGAFTAGPMIWAAAHTTQFTKPGWSYLPVGTGAGTGAGLLANGGTYLTIADWTSGKTGAAADYTIVIEKMSSEHSSCVRPYLQPYPSGPEVATFKLTGHLASIKTLNVWYTHWAYAAEDKTVEFERRAPIAVAADGTFSLNITVDSIYTLTTRTDGAKGVPSAPVAKPFLFPATWTDSFESCAESSEAAYWADQNGAWECKNSGDPTHGIVMQQQVPLKPVTWGGDIRPHSLIGHRDTFDASFVIDAFIAQPGASVLLGVHMQGTDNSAGILLLFPSNSNQWALFGTIKDVNTSKPIATGLTPMKILAGAWHTYRVDINGSLLNVWVDGQVAAANANVSTMTRSGHFLIGCGDYGQYTQFDNVQLYSTFRDCAVATPAAGSPIVNSNCIAEVGPVPHTLWNFNNPPNNGSGVWNGTFSLRKFPTLCLASAPPDAAGTPWLVLANCNAADPAQQ
jgi:galactosylceramidase